jgi:DNA processing protein
MNANKVNMLKLGPTELKDLLLGLDDPPKYLYALGDTSLLKDQDRHRLAIVGSRKVSPYGRAITEQLAGAAAKEGIVIVSGLALGVDSIAHYSALRARGKTIAVLPSAIQNIYPATHRHLAKQIVDAGGLLISEYVDTTPPQKYQFIARNRIIAALSHGVLITEAAQRSGSLHTAQFALEMGKSVMACPGNITSPTSQGANQLIKSGCTPITEPTDVYEELNFAPKANNALDEEELYDNDQATIVELLKGGVSNAEELQILSGLSIQKFNQALSFLEIEDIIKPMGSNHWTLRR